MQYAVRIKSKRKSNPKKIEHGEKVKEAVKNTRDEETGELITTFAAERRVKEVKKIKDKDGLEYEVEIDNLEEIIEDAKKIALKADEIEYHVCHHDEGISRPCGPWCKAGD